MRTDSSAGLLGRIAWACVMLMLAVTTASAWLRLAAPRPACLDWPGCRAVERPAAGVAAASPPALTAVTRGVHRVAASTVLVGVIALVALSWRRRTTGRAAAIDASVLLALALGLSALGVATPGSDAVGVLLGNQLGGLAMLALAWRLLRRVQGAPPLRAPWPALAATAAAVWLLQAAWGALAGARMADAAPMAHVATALVALPLAAVVGWQAHAQGRRAEGLALMAIMGVQGLLGAAAAAGAAAPLGVLAHNVGAAIGVAGLLGLSAPAGRARA
jgi:hypothetical protein